MVDWNGLFKWSMQYNDGTASSQFKEMSKEDRKWLEDALKQYTFNDTDKLKEYCEELKNHTQLESKRVKYLLEEVEELVEMHPRSSLNICLCGGMQTMFDIVFNNADDACRSQACAIISYCNQNNPDVQNIVRKMAPLNLMHQYLRESDVKNREAVLSALSSFLSGKNIESKQQFLASESGLSFIKEILANKTISSVRLQKKVLLLIFDLILCDEITFGSQDQTYVRRSIANDTQLMSSMVEFLNDSNFDDYQRHEIREAVLKSLVYIVNYKKTKLDEIKPTLDQYEHRLAEAISNKQGDFVEYLTREVDLIQDVRKAPTIKIKSNFENGDTQNVIHLKDGDEEKKGSLLGLQ